MIIKLTTGDWSGDGHCISEDHYYAINCTAKELQEAYKKGSEILGVDMTETCARDYEDNSISVGDFKKFYEHGIFDDEDKEWAEEYCFEETLDEADDIDVIDCFWGEMEFQLIWMKVAKLGRPDLTYCNTSSKVPEIKIGGYGLYSQ